MVSAAYPNLYAKGLTPEIHFHAKFAPDIQSRDVYF